MSDAEHPAEDADADEGAILPRRRVQDSAEMDITPMIDITFLLLIFFLVCSTMSQTTAVQLPPAGHGTGVDEDTAVVFTIDGEGDERPRVYVGLDTTGELLPDDHEAQEEIIGQAVEEGMLSGKTTILVKAARGVKSGEVERVAKAAAAMAEGAAFHIAVTEVR